MKRKKWIAALAAVAVLAAIAAWRHPTALDEIPEYAWERETEFTVNLECTFTEEGLLPLASVNIDFTEEELRELLSDAHLWRTTDPNKDSPIYIIRMPFFRLDFNAGDEGYSMHVYDDGYVAFVQIEYVYGQEVNREVRYFWDNGNLLQLLCVQYEDAVQEAIDKCKEIEND